MIEMGDKVVDIISGFKGIAVGRCEYFNGCVKFLVEPRHGKGDPTWIDEQTLQVLKPQFIDRKAVLGRFSGSALRGGGAAPPTAS